MLVKEKLIEFYVRYDLPLDGGVNQDWNKFNLNSISFSLPNLNKQGYLFHDINHLLCGYGVDWLSEFETAAWEIGSGGRKGFKLSWFYPVVGALLGLIIIPSRTFAAYREGSKRKNAHILSKDHDVLDLEMEELYELSLK